MTMNRDLGVWTSEDCALVLIDYQKEMFEVIRSDAGAVPNTALAVVTELFRDWRRRSPAPPRRSSTGTSPRSRS
jgi:hypothetical protein